MFDVVAEAPNPFMSYGPNTHNGSPITMAEYEAAALRHIEWMDANDTAAIDGKPEAEQQYNGELKNHMDSAVLWNSLYHAILSESPDASSPNTL